MLTLEKQPITICFEPIIKKYNAVAHETLPSRYIHVIAQKMYRIRLILFLSLLLQASMRGHAQNSKVDSLQQALRTARPDSNKVKLLLALSDAYAYPYRKSRIDSALIAGRSAKSLSDQIFYKYGQLSATEKQARAYMLKLRVDSATVLYRQLLPDAIQYGDVALIADTEFGLGACLVKRGQTLEGRKYLYTAIENARKRNKSDAETKALLSIGVSYMIDEQYNEGFDTVMLAFERYKKADNYLNIAYAGSILSQNYLAIKQYEQALNWARISFDAAQKINDPISLASGALNLGVVFTKKRQVDSAEYYLMRALQFTDKEVTADHFMNAYYSLSVISELKKDDQAQIRWLTKFIELEKSDQVKFSPHSFDVKISRGFYYLKINRLKEARGDFEEAVKIAELWQNWNAMSEAYSGLSQIAERSGQTQEAFKYYKMHIAARDSLFNEESTRKLTQIEMNHEFSQKQALAKAVQDRELALRDARSRQQSILFALVLLVLLGAAAFGFYTYRQRQERRRTELELASLRAQINPHFIFNCLNSIYRYTKERDTDTAAKYLQKFSSLLRLVLENSRTEKITLARDLEALQLYVDIEALRFKEKLQYSMETDPEIDTTFLLIPGMLIQPHVENAIWHGLMHRREGGHIRVRLTQPAESLLRVEIEDDGIGRAAAAELESKSALTKKSLGQKITAERLRATGKLAHTETIDLTTANGNAAGTKVVMEIPL